MISMSINVIIALLLYYIVSQNLWKDCKPIIHISKQTLSMNINLDSHLRNRTHAILSFVDYIINSIENNNISRGIYLDIRI